MSMDTQAEKRLSALFDDGAYTELDRFGCSGVITAYGTVNGSACYAFSQNIDSDGAAMSVAQAEKIGRVYSLAEKTGCPVVGIFDSNGGKLCEGMETVNAYSSLIASSDRISGVVPQIAVVAGVCAASAAVWALCSDTVIMSQKGELFVTAPLLLGDGVGTADAAVKNGTAHIACDDDISAVKVARDVLLYLPSNNISCPAETDCVPAIGAFPAETAADAVNAVADEGSVTELRAGFGQASVTAFAHIAGASAGIVAVYGKITADDCAKIASFVSICDAFSVPVITLTDTEGFDSTSDGELGGMAKAAAVLTKAYANATTVKITLVTGKAYGVAFTALAGKSSGADAVYALKDAVISPIAPEAAATILYNDRILAGEDKQSVYNDYIENDASAQACAAAGVIDDVFTADCAVEKLLDAIDMLSSKRTSILDKKHVVLSF